VGILFKAKCQNKVCILSTNCFRVIGIFLRINSDFFLYTEINLIFLKETLFLGAFAKLRKATISFVMPTARLH